MKLADKTYLICGFPRNGKSTFGKALSKALGVKCGDTSDIIYRHLANELSVTLDQLRSLPKSEIRQQLVATGNALTASDPASLAMELLKGGCSVICGVRRLNEFKAVQQAILKATGQHAVPIWVELEDAPFISDNTSAFIEAQCVKILIDRVDDVEGYMENLIVGLIPTLLDIVEVI